MYLSYKRKSVINLSKKYQPIIEGIQYPDVEFYVRKSEKLLPNGRTVKTVEHIIKIPISSLSFRDIDVVCGRGGENTRLSLKDISLEYLEGKFTDSGSNIFFYETHSISDHFEDYGFDSLDDVNFCVDGMARNPLKDMWLVGNEVNNGNELDSDIQLKKYSLVPNLEDFSKLGDWFTYYPSEEEFVAVLNTSLAELLLSPSRYNPLFSSFEDYIDHYYYPNYEPGNEGTACSVNHVDSLLWELTTTWINLIQQEHSDVQSDTNLDELWSKIKILNKIIE